MFGTKENKDPWRNGVYLTTANSTLQAGILESKLSAEGIPCLKRYEGASNFLEIYMGVSTVFPVEIYVPEDKLELAKEVIKPVPIDDDFEEATEEEWLDIAGSGDPSEDSGAETSDDMPTAAGRESLPGQEEAPRRHGRQRKVQNRQGPSKMRRRRMR